ncbi:MAG: aspartate carbamoyltransferase catalytic subunit [Planctomycetota bacterium]
MRPAKRDYVSTEDLSNDEVLALFRYADEFHEDLRAHSATCPGTILATLFFEPSTRTRLSFESAMLRLGGGVISAAEARATSAAKGETLADTARIVGGRYADIIVLRHPDEGSAKVLADYAEVPVVNGGDGGHEHPTQTLCDLYTLWKEKGRLSDLEVVLCGDLKHSRTIQSLVHALARFGAHIVCMPFPGLELPGHVLERLQRDFGSEIQRADLGDLPGIGKGKDAIYVTPSRPHQQTLFTRLSAQQIERIDAIYMTRSQRERQEGGGSEDYVTLGPEQLAEKRFQETSVLHPLPRVGEISYELDRDKRAVYFRQAAFGVPIRMALLAFLLGKIDLGKARPPKPTAQGTYRCDEGLRCPNASCITNREGRRYLVPEFRILRDVPPMLACAYCGLEQQPAFVGHVRSRKLHRGNAPEAARISPERRVYFLDHDEAVAKGFGQDANG